MSIIDALHQNIAITQDVLAQETVKEAGKAISAYQESAAYTVPPAADSATFSPQAIVAAAPFISDEHSETLSATAADGTIATVAKRTGENGESGQVYTVTLSNAQGGNFSLDFTGDVSISKTANGGYAVYHAETDVTDILAADGTVSQTQGRISDENADAIIVSTSGGTVKTGDGNNTVFVYGDNATVEGGDGNDTVVLNNGVSGVTVDTGAATIPS